MVFLQSRRWQARPFCQSFQLLFLVFCCCYLIQQFNNFFCRILFLFTLRKNQSQFIKCGHFHALHFSFCHIYHVFLLSPRGFACPLPCRLLPLFPLGNYILSLLLVLVNAFLRFYFISFFFVFWRFHIL